MSLPYIISPLKMYYNMNKMSGIVSFRKNILGWLGDRTTAPSLLVRALYRCLVDTERGGGGSISQPT